MTRPRFSVLVPVYNAASYLPACIESALRQEGSDYELVLFDDGSDDGCGPICDRYAEANPNVVRTFHQENAGLVLTRRRALAAARGEYVVFLDADDCLAEGALEALRRELLADGDPPDVVIYHCARMDACGALTGRESPAFFSEAGSVSRADVLTAMARWEDLNSLCLKMIRRELYDLDTDYAPFSYVTNGEDLLQFLPVVLRAERFRYLPRALYLYRQNEQSMTYISCRGNVPYLTLVRPRLLEALESAGLDTDENLSAFFQISAQRILYMLSAAAARSEEGLEPLLVKLLSEPGVRQILPYIGGAPFTAFRRFVLRVYLRGRLSAALGLLRFRNRILGVS